MAESHHANSHQANVHKMLEIDLDELLNLVPQAESDEGLTVEEWRTQTGLSHSKTRHMIKIGVGLGKLKRGTRTTPGHKHWSGRTIVQTVYMVAK